MKPRLATFTLALAVSALILLAIHLWRLSVGAPEDPSALETHQNILYQFRH